VLMMDEAGYKWLAKLESELSWLRENHPDMTALIGIAEGHLRTVRMAGSTDSLTIGGGAGTDKGRMLYAMYEERFGKSHAPCEVLAHLNPPVVFLNGR
jgi:hypothetical protein